MRKIRPQDWKKMAEAIASGLGKDRVKSDISTITMRFDLNNLVEMMQFQNFGHIALDNKLIFVPRVVSGKTIEVSFSIQNKTVALVRVAEAMEVRVSQKPNGEIHRRITPHDPEYILQNLTGVPWDQVSASRYNTEVMEAILPDAVDAPTRRRQEFGLGNALRPEGRIAFDVRNWLEEQTNIENEARMPPSVTIPRDWVFKSGVSNASNVKSSIRETLPKLFSKER